MCNASVGAYRIIVSACDTKTVSLKMILKLMTNFVIFVLCELDMQHGEHPLMLFSLHCSHSQCTGVGISCILHTNHGTFPKTRGLPHSVIVILHDFISILSLVQSQPTSHWSRVSLRSWSLHAFFISRWSSL